ncbi:MAG: hypothetical protein P8L91_01320 [Candidatus Marinimicrobia bacterium]|nr:hypothetical protein [Candidatus Neomarinimicrobiota bacterium]
MESKKGWWHLNTCIVMGSFKEIVNTISNPTILFTSVLILFPFVFPPTDWFEKWHRKLGLHHLWGTKAIIIAIIGMAAFFIYGLGDYNFQKIVLKPDNVPISGMIFLVVFFTWLSMHQAYKNDERLDAGQKPDEFYEAPNDKVLVWPDLVYVELISLIIMSAFLLVWSIGLPAPIEEPANPTESPNPAKAPWYFLGLQEMLVYFDPWMAGVVLPSLIIVALMAMPYIDRSPENSGFYSYKRRRLGISLYMFGWLVLWQLLIIVGTVLRGPNWNFFGPFEYWDVHKLEALTNINLSEIIYIKFLSTGLPTNILIREIWGILLTLGYFLILPPLLAKTILNNMYEKLGVARYSIFIVLIITALTLPIKMYLRWIFNLKYIISIPEYFFNF